MDQPMGKRSTEKRKKKKKKKEIRSEGQCSGALCRTKGQEREYKNGEKRQDVSLRLPLAVVGG